MAQAQVVITAVDRTKAAIAQAERGMKGLEKTAKVTGKAINLAFGMLTGAALMASFGKIIDAAKKTNEGAQAIDRLNKALKDPALVAAANSFTSTLVGGFSRVVEFAAKAAKEVMQFGRSIGLVSAASPTAQSAKSMGSRYGRVYKSTATEQDLTEAYTAILRSRFDIDKPKTGEGKAKGKSAKDFMAEIRRDAAEHRQKMFTESMNDLEKHLLKTIDEVDTKLNIELTDSVANLMQERIEGLTDAVANAAMQMRDAFADFLFDPFQNGLRGMLSGFLNIVRRMVADLAAQALLKSFFGAFSGGTGIMGDIARAALTGLGGRAMGGPVTGNTPYIVGERGPELFMPSTSGAIVPNHKLGGGMTVAPVYNIDARGATMELTQALPTILADNNRRIFDELDRRYGIRR